MKTTISIFFLTISIAIFGQNELNLNSSYQWASDSTITINLKSTNFKQACLVNLEAKAKNDILFKKDSILVGKGIFSLKHELQLPEKYIPDVDSITDLKITLINTKTNNLTAKALVSISLADKPKPMVKVNDSCLIIVKQKGDNIQVKVTGTPLSNQSHQSIKRFKLNTNDTLYIWDLADSLPYIDRKFQLDLFDGKRLTKTKLIYFQDAIFSNSNDSIFSISHAPDTLRDDNNIIDFNGDFYFENNAFKTTPQHASQLQYPSTIFRASNTISLFGLPFNFNAYHNTSQIIDPNFRNFFSLQFDVNAYRKTLSKKLIQKAKLNEYTIDEIDNDLENNQQSINRLKAYKRIAQQYPEANALPDSLLEKEKSLLFQSTLKDTIPIENNSQILNHSNVNDFDIDSNQSKDKLSQIDQLIEQFEISNQYKSALKEQKLQAPKSSHINDYSPNSLYQQFDSYPASFLRIQKLQIGYFYEEGGKYSIRDVELQGVNTSILISPEIEIGLLRAKINSFQSFNLDEIEDYQRVSSGYLRFHHSIQTNSTFRVTEFNKLNAGNELNPIGAKNYVLSVLSNGSIKERLQYAVELNQSQAVFKVPFEETTDPMKSLAISTDLELQLNSSISLVSAFDQVGSSYSSEGVFFLIRNTQSYSFGTKLKLVKNKIYFKNNYTLINRNYEEKDLQNQTTKFFFDLSTRFKRIPNIQVIHSPVTIEIANKLDTSFSGINALSTVTIARLFYIKRIKRTLINSALLYNEIQNNFFYGLNRQNGFQHFVGLGNKKTQFTFTTSYNSYFESLRFASTSFRHQLNNTFSASLYAARNYMNDFYLGIIRSKVDIFLKKTYVLGLGGVLLFENSSINLGSTVSLKIHL